MRSIVGTWALVGGKRTSADGSPEAPPYGGAHGVGRVTFTADGQMVCVLCDCSPSLPVGQPREYNSYCGNYTFDGSKLVTKVFANSDPARLSADQVRAVEFRGNRLVMRPPAAAARPGEPVVQREMWFEKIADG